MWEISYYKASLETFHFHYHSCVQRRQTITGHTGESERNISAHRSGISLKWWWWMTARATAPSRWLATAGARVLQNPGNRGKGYCVKHGMLEAKGEWTLFTDADLSSPIGEVGEALERRGARTRAGRRSARAPWTARWSACTSLCCAKRSAACSICAMRLVTGLPFRDTQCGFKLFRDQRRREVFSRSNWMASASTWKSFSSPRQLGFKSVEVPVRWDNVEGTKVSMLLGFVAFMDPLKVRRNGYKANTANQQIKCYPRLSVSNFAFAGSRRISGLDDDFPEPLARQEEFHAIRTARRVFPGCGC